MTTLYSLAGKGRLLTQRDPAVQNCVNGEFWFWQIRAVLNNIESSGVFPNFNKIMDCRDPLAAPLTAYVLPFTTNTDAFSAFNR